MSEKVVIVSGKRKTAVARATATNGNGKVTINDVPLELLQPAVARMKIQEPIFVVGGELSNKVDATSGLRGRLMAQAEAAGSSSRTPSPSSSAIP